MSESWCNRCQAQTDWHQWDSEEEGGDQSGTWYQCESCGHIDYNGDEEDTEQLTVERLERCILRLYKEQWKVLADWQQCGERIMAAIGKPGQQLSDSDVIGEIEQLRFEQQEARKAAREFFRDVAEYRIPEYVEKFPWLESAENAE